MAQAEKEVRRSRELGRIRELSKVQMATTTPPLHCSILLHRVRNLTTGSAGTLDTVPQRPQGRGRPVQESSSPRRLYPSSGTLQSSSPTVRLLAKYRGT